MGKGVSMAHGSCLREGEMDGIFVWNQECERDQCGVFGQYVERGKDECEDLREIRRADVLGI